MGICSPGKTSRMLCPRNGLMCRSRQSVWASAVVYALFWLLIPAGSEVVSAQETIPALVKSTPASAKQTEATPSSDAPADKMAEILAAHRRWIQEFSAIRIQWKEWHKATLHLQNQSLSVKLRLEDSPMYTTGELCWKRNAGTTLSEVEFSNGRTSSRNLLGRDGQILWLASTSPGGSSLKWDSVQQLPYILDQPIRISRGTIGLRGFWDFALGSFTLRIAGAEVGQTELVDGHECIVVRKMAPDSTIPEESYWLDPNVGYLPRRYLRIRSGSRAVRFEDWKADEFRELRTSFFFPWHGSVRLNREPRPGYEWQITGVDLKPTFSDSQFVVPIEFETASPVSSMHSAEPPPEVAVRESYQQSIMMGVIGGAVLILALGLVGKNVLQRR